ncbi:MAG: VWA domain-containing protein [Myxococcaceae bacterium]|nr:VWA domain-containing protein [Myxococcaceae bacterium]
MSLGAPLGLLALLAAVPLVAAYFLRRRQKPVQVSALFLWRTPDQRAEAGPRLERFSRELSLLLELLAVVAAAAFLSDLGCGAQAEQRHLVIVLDGSMSMSARGADGTTVAERVRTEAAKLAAGADADLLTLVESGVTPRVLAGPAEKTSRALAALGSWHPMGAAHDLQPALLLARELSGPGERLVAITDALPDAASLPPEVEVRALGEARENAAIVAAQRTDEGVLARLSVRVANFGGEARRIPVHLSGAVEQGAPIVQEHTLEVPAGGSALLVAGLKNVGAVTVALPEDALPEDGTVLLLPSPPRVVGISVEGVDVATRAAIDRFVKVAPGVAEVGQNGALAFGPRDGAGNVTFGAPGTQRTFVGPFFAERGHPVLEDVQLGGVVWTAGENPPGHPLLSAGGTVLLSEDDSGRLHFNIALARSNLQRTPAWPVLMGNLVRRARASLPGFPRRHLVLGEEIPVVVEAGHQNVLRGPDGTRPIFGSGPVLMPAPAQPGRYELLRDGEVADALEDLAVDPRESDLRDRGAGLREASAGALATHKASHERAPWALVAFLALLMIDFALTSGRRVFEPAKGRREALS